MLRLLRTNTTHNLKGLGIKEGELIQIKWSSTQRYDDVSWTTVTFPPDTDDENSENDKALNICQKIRKRLREKASSPSCTSPTNKQSKSTTNETVVDNATNMDILAKAAVVVETKDSMALETSKVKDTSQHDDSDHDSFNTTKESLGLEDDTNDMEKKKAGT